MLYPMFCALLLASLFIATVPPAAAQSGPEYGGLHTKERIANLRVNVARYDWARVQKVSAVAAAERWVKLSDEELWAMVPGQNLPRTIDPCMDWGVRKGGCPTCGLSIYEYDKYPWRADVWGKPWKITCPKCGADWPKNDFGDYYRSGIDETGCFNPEKANRSLLFNTEYPDPADPLRGWAVDDGWGWQSPDGGPGRFIGYYGYVLWGVVKNGAAALANAYLYTGDPIYARKCGVLLDRIADVYPAMDWSAYGQKGWFHSGSQDGGKIEGSIWECGTVAQLAGAYDQVKSGLWNQPDLYAFLSQKGKQYKLPGPKGSYDNLISNIETNLIEEFVKAVQSGRKIYGNEGGPQANVVECAVALNREPKTTEWLDWLFREGTVGQGALRPGEGGHIPSLIVATIDRDGAGAEGSPGYSLGWGEALGMAADLLADYGKYKKHDIYRDYPQFRRTLTVGWRLALLATSTPNIGDTGACGSRGGIIGGTPNFIVRGYKYLKDPEIGLIAVWANHGKTEGLGRDILAADPYRIEKDLAELVRKRGSEPPIEGRNNAGYGLVSVEFGPRDTGQGLWMYYGLNDVAGHKSELMFGYDAYGFTVCPPLGYRELWGSWPKSVQWEDTTLSHNTVVVNETAQSGVRVGQPEFFAQLPGFGAFAVDSRNVYPGIVRTYRRTMALMQVGEEASYALDVFRIEGGKDHLLSFHALPGPVSAEGLRLVKQETGSYDGPDIPWQTSRTGPRMGYSWLDNVERDAAPADRFTLDYRGTSPYWNLKEEDALHVRYHGFTRYDDIALADGYPPAGQASGQPKKLRYLLAHRAGASDLNTASVGLIEPFKGAPLIRKASRLKVTGPAAGQEAVALKVDLADGATDYLLCGPDDTTPCRAEGGIGFTGRLAALRVRRGEVAKAWLIRAARVARGRFAMSLPSSGYRGKIVRMSRDIAPRGYVWVDCPLPEGAVLRGSEIIVANDGHLNASYTIESVVRDGSLWKIDCGPVSFIRSFRDMTDYSKGYLYNFSEGAEWIIPMKGFYEAKTGPGSQLQANAPIDLKLPVGKK
ncbi:MAG: heparinase [Armatimonadetes bacterium]|nr:heparinase [Armatimonadota bacterium]